MNIFVFSITLIFGFILFIEPFVDHGRWFSTQPVRMRIFHKIFTTRNWIFSFFQQQQSNISSQYQAFEEIVRLHYPPLYLPDTPSNQELIQFRSSAKEIFTGLYPRRDIKTCKIEPITFEYNGRKVLSYSIRDGDINDWTEMDQKFFLYIHGGGFVYGDIETYSGYECYLSREYRMPVIHIEYGLAPEHTVFWALDDVVTVYMALLKLDPNIHKRMIGIGDSSGGLLWLRLIQIIVKQEQSVPRALILFSPWVDISFADIEHDSETQQKRVLFTLQLALNLRRQAFHIRNDVIGPEDIAKFSKQLNEINPNEYSFKGFPPLYVNVGTEEIFLWDAIILRTKIFENNGQIILEEGFGLMHNYCMFHLWSPEAQCTQEYVRKFIEQF